jgi:hypothetical protein
LRFSATKLTKLKSVDSNPTLKVIGYLAGEILEIGPECTSLAASFEAHEDWLDCWQRHYQSAADLERLRWINEEYTAKIMAFGEKDLERIREVRNQKVTARKSAGEYKPNTLDQEYAAEYNKLWAETENEKSNNRAQGPSICLGTSHLIGLVPAPAKVGDVIVRFWGCDAAMVMRPVARNGSNEYSAFVLVGRADVAEVVDRKETPGRDAHAERALSGGSGNSRTSGPVLVKLDFVTLQIITAYVTC